MTVVRCGRPKVWAAALLVLAAAMAAGCWPTEVRSPAPLVAKGEHDPAVWGRTFPREYATWLATAEERPAGKSLYKRGFDGGRTYDKLSESPFMALLFKGWGFGVEYNEPRGHYYMLIDQQTVDPSRVKAGGACLTCKSPYAEDLYEKDKNALFAATYPEAVAMLPEGQRQLGAACIDCHDTATLELKTRRWTVKSALEEIGKPESGMTRNERRLIVCGQCHCTYSVMKDGTRSVDVDFPWEGGKWGAITVETIIADLEEQQPRHEWNQQVTGFKLGFIRHPDLEFFSAGSPHFNSGATCNDCHMPLTRVDGKWTADHNAISPLKRDMVACRGCHTASADEMRAKVIAIQQATVSRLIDTGYHVATVAKLIELANARLDATTGVPAYDDAAAHYRQAFYRVLYMGAENSVGFHNPAEAERILKDADVEAAEAERVLRELLSSKGVAVPAEVQLGLRSYLDGRGVRQLHFMKDEYIPDPDGTAPKRWPASLGALLR